MLLDHVNGKENKIIRCFPQNTEFGNPLSDWFFYHYDLFMIIDICAMYKKNKDRNTYKQCEIN